MNLKPKMLAQAKMGPQRHGPLAGVPEVIFMPSYHWELKAGMPLGVTRATPDVGFQFQLTWKFGHEGRQ